MRKRLALVVVGLLMTATIDALAQRLPLRESPSDVLTADEWKRVDQAVERALEWLAREQRPDGSFPTLETGQPGVTSLCIMAFVSHGHVPGDGRHGKLLERATDFVLSCQKDNGLVTLLGPIGPLENRHVPEHEIGICAAYNHAISSLVLSEAYGMSRAERAARIERAVERALRVSLAMQRWPKDRGEDVGGWRYIDDVDSVDSDLSVTGWELMFLRSARNAGFDVDEKPIADAIEYIRRCYAPELGTFEYANGLADDQSRCMAGAGILALAHAGYHQSEEAQRSGRWLLQHDFTEYNVLIPFNQQWVHDRYHYGLFNSCQGMYQLGGEYWRQFFPPTVATLLANQQLDGSWPSDSHWHDGQFGNAYTTALVVMTLGAPNQLLPVFQR